MAQALRSHGRKVFSRRAIDTDLLREWLMSVFPEGGDGGCAQGIPWGREEWRVRREDVEGAVKQAGNTMPGPDRIPYKAWRILGDIGVDILFQAAEALQADNASELLCQARDLNDSEDDHDFNLGILCCLPKKTGDDRALRAPRLLLSFRVKK